MTRLPIAVRALARTTPGSVVDRWAWYVFRGAIAESDLKTLANWAEQVAVSVSALRETCKMLQVLPHDARDLMRALSAMFRSSQLGCEPSILLDIADIRTLRRFQKRAGPAFRASADPAEINDFLESQCFVDPKHHGIRILASLITLTFRSSSDHSLLENGADGTG